MTSTRLWNRRKLSAGFAAQSEVHAGLVVLELRAAAEDALQRDLDRGRREVRLRQRQAVEEQVVSEA